MRSFKGDFGAIFEDRLLCQVVQSPCRQGFLVDTSGLIGAKLQQHSVGLLGVIWSLSIDQNTVVALTGRGLEQLHIVVARKNRTLVELSL